MPPPTPSAPNTHLPASLADVARLASVSLSTASRALDPSATHPVRPSTRQRVVEAARTLDYRPNLLARGLRASRLSMLAVVVHDLADPYFAEIVRGAAEEAAQDGYLTFVCSSGRDAGLELRYVEMLRLSRVSAVLFAAGGLDAPDANARIVDQVAGIQEYGGTVVALAPREEPWATEICDNREGMRLATQHLLELGHERVACISGPPHVLTSREREAGYLAATEAAGVAPLIERADFSTPGGVAATVALLDGDRPFTALAVAGDTMALGTLAELRRRGLSVPGDLSVTGFGDIPAWDYEHPALTTVRVGLAEIGAAGARRALQLLEGPSTGPRVRVHPVQLIVRDSTAPPRWGHDR